MAPPRIPQLPVGAEDVEPSKRDAMHLEGVKYFLEHPPEDTVVGPTWNLQPCKQASNAQMTRTQSSIQQYPYRLIHKWIKTNTTPELVREPLLHRALHPLRHRPACRESSLRIHLSPVAHQSSEQPAWRMHGYNFRLLYDYSSVSDE